MIKLQALATATTFALFSGSTLAAKPGISFEKVWTYVHSAIPGQVSEIPAFDPATNTLWIVGIVGVDVLDARNGELLAHIDTTSWGLVNSVAIHDGLAAFAIESAVRTEPGVVVFYDTKTRAFSNSVTVGALPDMLTYTHDGSKLLVANEATPTTYGTRIGTSVPFVFGSPPFDPVGSVSIIDVRTRSVVATAGLDGVPTTGSNLRLRTGMGFEPEYIAVDMHDRRAYVTLQEANAIAVLDLDINRFTTIIGLGVKDFGLPGNQIDALDNGEISFISAAAKGLYMPDGIATYRWRGRTFMVTANEGDFREDDGDRSAASTLGAAAPLNRLRVSNTDSTTGDLYAAGGRSFSIRDEEGNLVYDSGDILDKEAFARGIYDDGRSRDKGVEPEGVTLLERSGRTYAFVGLERTTIGAVAVFDITDPTDVEFVDMIVTAGDLAPEGLATFRYRGDDYLVIANEVSGTTTLYRVGRAKLDKD